MVEKKKLKYSKPELLDLGGLDSTLGDANCLDTGSQATSACAPNGASAAGCSTGSSATPDGCGSGNSARFGCGVGNSIYV